MRARSTLARSAFFSLSFNFQRSLVPQGLKILNRDATFRLQDGGAEGDRTLDLRLAKPALSQLSYGPSFEFPWTVWPVSVWVRDGGPGKS